SHALDRLAAVGDLHQLGGAASADVHLVLEQCFPFFPGAGVRRLERHEILPGGNVMLLGFLGGLIALGDVGLDLGDQVLSGAHGCTRSAVRRAISSSTSWSCQRLTPVGFSFTAAGNFPAFIKRRIWVMEYRIPRSFRSWWVNNTDVS